MNKFFLITIDTEGDNMWRRLYSKNSLKRITNKNGQFLERFQILCEKFHFIPTYLTNYEMSLSDAFREMAKERVKNNLLEIGMHMHAWNCPPYYPLTPGKNEGENPYIGEYPTNIIRKKVLYLTKLLEESFECKITSHRSGRWYLDRTYINILKECGYIVDCSVTPGMNWGSKSINCAGLTAHSCGTDYRFFPNHTYEMDLHHIHKKGNSGMVEVPVTINQKHFLQKKHIWLRPNGNNLKDMISLVEKKEKSDYIEFMLHSSELMPGGSPNFQTQHSIENLYNDINSLFTFIAQKNYMGISLSNYAKKYLKKEKNNGIFKYRNYK